MVAFESLNGQTLKSIQINESKNEILFETECGKKYLMHHDQDCCENVSIDDICGNLNDLIGSPITLAEEGTSGVNPADVKLDYQDNSFTWTFYRLATVKGYVTIRWYGESNGYYSEAVDFVEITQ